ncbi:MAG: aspartate aminotransferase family protein [Spirochaetales bacterium]|nr:aspartate aminotransferase family protein [Spirochaetales bacterium]
MESENKVSREQGDINQGKSRIKYWKRNFDSEAEKWFEEDKKYFFHQALSTPVLNILSRTDGIYIYDMTGKKYIDMHGNGVHNAGFSNPEVIEAVKKQLDEKLCFTPRRFSNVPAIKFAEKLAEITPPGLEKSLFCPGGSEAIEMSITLAKQVTGNFRTISFWDSFHGAGYQAASVGGEEHFKGGYGPMVPGAFKVEFPNYYRNPWGFKTEEEVDSECLRQMEIIFKREPGVAAVLGEPISATPVVPSRDYWVRVRDMAHKYGALLIFDEIIEGFGRTGKMFACEHFVTPDILVLGKSFGGGLVPFAGIVARGEYDIFSGRSIGHYTHEKNPLCSAAGLAEIEYLEKHALVENAAEIGEYTIERFNSLKERHPMIGNVAGVGCHIGIDLVKNPVTKERAVDEAEAVMYKCMEKGLAFKIIESNIITLRPSLLITKDEMEWCISTIEEAIGEVEKGSYY